MFTTLQVTKQVMDHDVQNYKYCGIIQHNTELTPLILKSPFP